MKKYKDTFLDEYIEKDNANEEKNSGEEQNDEKAVKRKNNKSNQRVDDKKAVKPDKKAAKLPSNKTTEIEIKQKVYDQFLNKLLMLLLTGVTAGGCLLAALDYLLVAQIPERSAVVMSIFVIFAVICLVYWYIVFIRAKGIEGLRGVALFATVISVIASCAGGYSIYTNTVNLNTYFYGEEIVIKDKKATAQTLIEYIETWRHTPNYSLTYISDDVFYATVYNSKGESVTQLILDDTADKLTDIAICLTDGTAVIVSDETIERRYDIDNLKYITNALNWVVSGNATIERASTSPTLIQKGLAPEDAFPGTEYAVIIEGVDNLKRFYTEAIGAEDAEEMFKPFVGMDISVIFNIMLGDGYITVGSSIYIDGQGNLLWYIEDYTEIYDWTLGEQDWYSYDYSDAIKNERMIEEAMYNITATLEQFSNDVGLAWDNFDINSEETTDVSAVTSSDGSGTADSTESSYISSRVYEASGQTITLYTDGTFYAELAHDVIKQGTYTETIFEIIFVYDGLKEQGYLSNGVLTPPTEWDDGHGHWSAFSLVDE